MGVFVVFGFFSWPESDSLVFCDLFLIVTTPVELKNGVLRADYVFSHIIFFVAFVFDDVPHLINLFFRIYFRPGLKLRILKFTFNLYFA